MQHNQWYVVTRMIGYAAGLIGVALFLVGKRMPEKVELIKTMGIALMGVMFCAFLVSYFLIAMMKVRNLSRGSSRFKVGDSPDPGKKD